MAGSKRIQTAREVEITVYAEPRRVEVRMNGALVLGANCQRILIHNPLASDRYSEGGSGDFINNSRFEPAEETDNAA